VIHPRYMRLFAGSGCRLLGQVYLFRDIQGYRHHDNPFELCPSSHDYRRYRTSFLWFVTQWTTQSVRLLSLRTYDFQKTCRPAIYQSSSSLSSPFSCPTSFRFRQNCQHLPCQHHDMIHIRCMMLVLSIIVRLSIWRCLSPR
jgi:hypothetical protein